MTELESGFSLADAAGLLRRRSAIVLAGAIIGLLAGYAIFSSAAPRYSATARVEVVSLGDSPSSPALAEIDLQTESDLVKSDAVGDAVRTQLKLDTDNRSLFIPLIVTVREKSRVLALTYESSSPNEARDIVNATARAYLAQRNQGATETRDAAVTALEAELAEKAQAQTDAETTLEGTTSGSPERSAANAALSRASEAVSQTTDDLAAARDADTTAGQLVREAPLPTAVLSKKALGIGVGIFGLCTLAGLAAALFVDRRDSMGGGRRRVEQLTPGANLRMMPTSVSRNPSPVEIDAAIDRLAVELAGGGSRGRSSSVLIAGTGAEPPLALAEELAASLTFAGIPALFILAGTSEREIRQIHVVTSFTDLITGPSITGPASLPDVAGAAPGTGPPLVTWLRPRGSAESSGLLRRAVVEALITRAGREGFEAVIFVAATPTRSAAAAALGQWVAKTAVIVEGDDSQGVEAAVRALTEADVAVTEVVWT